MSRATSNVVRLTLLAAVALALAPAACAADATPAPADNARFAPAADNATALPLAPADLKKARHAAMRKVAAVSLVLILVLICFIVGVMMVTRRMRIRYLHYDRKVTFSRLWDVWWHPRGDASGGAKKKPKS